MGKFVLALTSTSSLRVVYCFSSTRDEVSMLQCVEQTAACFVGVAAWQYSSVLCVCVHMRHVCPLLLVSDIIGLY